MEVAGTAVSFAGILSLFQTCVQCFEYVQYGRHFGETYEAAVIELDFCRLRLTRWGKSIGLTELLTNDSNTSPNSAAAKDLLSGKEKQLAWRLLGQIQTTFEEAKKHSSEHQENMELMGEDSDTFKPLDENVALSNKFKFLHIRTKEVVQKRQKEASLTQKTRWALYERNRFTELVQRIKSSMDMLEKTFPQAHDTQVDLAKEEVQEIAGKNIERLKVIQEATKNIDPIMTEAVRAALADVEGQTFENIQVNGAAAFLGNDIEYGTRVKGSRYTGMVISNGSVVHAGNIYRAQGQRAGNIFQAQPRRFIGAGPGMRPGTNQRDAGNPQPQYEDPADDDMYADARMQSPKMIGKSRTNSDRVNTIHD